VVVFQTKPEVDEVVVPPAVVTGSIYGGFQHQEWYAWVIGHVLGIFWVMFLASKDVAHQLHLTIPVLEAASGQVCLAPHLPLTQEQKKKH
jgi:integral membrane sensor domain MASE1